jgi:hypothetical protein
MAAQGSKSMRPLPSWISRTAPEPNNLRLPESLITAIVLTSLENAVNANGEQNADLSKNGGEYTS